MATVHLKRTLGLLETTFYGVGVIVGAGIYALIGKAAGLAGNAVWAAFVLCAFIAAFTGLSYAELSSMFPKAGGEYIYVEKAFNRRLAFLIGWLIVIGGIVAAATISLGFAGYFAALFNTPIIPVAIILILILSLINFWGIRESAIANIIGTLVEVGGLIIIVALSLKYFGSVNYMTLPPLGFTGILSATALIFFAFLGFEDIVRLSEETKNPTRTIPKALILSIVISTILYILVAIAAVSVVGWETLSTTSAPLALVAQTAFGQNAFVVLSVIALFATYNTVLVTLIATSRMLYGMAANHGLPKIFSVIYPKFQTPWLAIAIVGITAALFALIGKIEFVAGLTDFALFTAFAIVNASVLWLRYKQPKTNRPFKTLIPFATFGALSSVAMLLYLEKTVVIGGLLALAAGFIIYELLVYMHKIV
ncbi:MAG: APC family permease [Candidatus Nanoarchaeia archaeon]